MPEDVKPPTGGDTTPAAGAIAKPQEPAKETPQPVPYDRFKEVNDGKKAAEERAAKLEGERAAERKQVADLKRIIDERIPAKEPTPEPEWQDPAELALKRVAVLEESQRQTVDALSRQQALAAIEKAITSRKFVAPEEVHERLAERYFLAKAMGSQFDPEAEAKRLYDHETATFGALKTAWAKEKETAEEATRTAMRGTSPPPGEPIVARPPINTPERKKWDEETEREIMRQFRT